MEWLSSYLEHPQLMGQFNQQTLPLLVFVISLLGSLHCVGMCGGIVMALPPRASAHRLYHLGRLAGYLFLGALAGYAGSWLVTYQHAMAYVAAVLLSLSFLWVGVMLWQGKSMHMQWPAAMQKLLQKGLGKSLSGVSDSIVSAGALGFLTVLMPCGWLYSFILGALLTGSMLKGAMFLGAFWLGTLPALVWGPGLLSRWLRKHSQASRKMVAIGFVMVAGLNIAHKFYSPFSTHSHGQITAKHLEDLTQDLNCH